MKTLSTVTLLVCAVVGFLRIQTAVFADSIFGNIPDENICSEPVQTFADMSNKGRVRYVAEMPLNLSAGTMHIPLRVMFNGTHVLSPSLGLAAWTFPLFDSNILQIDERHFEVLLPDGYKMTLTRDLDNPTVLQGCGQWSGNIGPDMIILSNGNKMRLSFKEGKIKDWEINDQKFSYFRSQLEGDKILCNGRIIAQIVPTRYDSVKLLLDGSDVIEIVPTQMPKLQKIKGLNVVAGITRSLGSIVVSGKKMQEFEYDIDGTMMPTLQIKGVSENRISWEPDTLQLRTSGNSQYDFRFDEEAPQSSFKVIRKDNSGGEVQVFERKSNGATTEMCYGENKREVVSVFTSGILKGKPKKFFSVDNSRKVIDEHTIAYSETGEPMRTSDRTQETGLTQSNYQYNAKNRKLTTVTVLRNGIPLSTYNFVDGIFDSKHTAN